MDIVLNFDISPYKKDHIYFVEVSNLIDENSISSDLIANNNTLWRRATNEEINYRDYIGKTFDVKTLYQDFKVGDIVVMKSSSYRVINDNLFRFDSNPYRKSYSHCKKTENDSIPFEFRVKEIFHNGNFFTLEYLGYNNNYFKDDDIFHFADFELVKCLIPYDEDKKKIKNGDLVFPIFSHIHVFNNNHWSIIKKQDFNLNKELRVKDIINKTSFKFWDDENIYYIHDFKVLVNNINLSEDIERIDIETLKEGEVLIPRRASIRKSLDNGISWNNWTGFTSDFLFTVKEISIETGIISFSYFDNKIVFHVDDFYRKNTNPSKKMNTLKIDTSNKLPVGTQLYPRNKIIRAYRDMIWKDFECLKEYKFFLKDTNNENLKMRFNDFDHIFKFSDFSINLEDHYIFKESSGKGINLYPRHKIIKVCNNDVEWIDFNVLTNQRFVISCIIDNNVFFQDLLGKFRLSDFSMYEEDDYLNKFTDIFEIKNQENEDNISLPKKAKKKISNKEFVFDLDKEPDTNIDIKFDFNKKQFKF